MRLGGHRHDGVERARDEVGELELDDRPLADPGCADRSAHEALLRDRGIEHPLGAELLQQAARRTERASEGADVLTEQEDALVLAERVAQRRVDGVEVRPLRHATEFDGSDGRRESGR